jgi:hypothetical protein
MILSGHYISKRFPAFALEKSLIIMWLISRVLKSYDCYTLCFGISSGVFAVSAANVIFVKYRGLYSYIITFYLYFSIIPCFP